MTSTLRPRGFAVVVSAAWLFGCAEPRSEPVPEPSGGPGQIGVVGAGGALRDGGAVDSPLGGGAGGTAGGGGGGGDGSCLVGATRCATGAPVVEVCTVTNEWMTQKTCPSICTNGECAGSCTPGDKQCGAEQKPATCQNGDWVPGDPCPYVCSGKGECTGECKPGTGKCGDGADKLTPYECDQNGKWVAKPVCVGLCSNGSCAGSCQPGSTRCVANAVETCSGMGTWDPGQPCKGTACVSGKCQGGCMPMDVRCGPGNAIQTCDANGNWQNTSTCTGKTCMNGVCMGSCEPGSPKRCSPDQKATQTCGPNGVWMNADSCGANGCIGDTCNMCKPGSKRCMGNTLQTCGADGKSFGQDQMCGISCDSATLVCKDTVDCNPPCNGSPHCMGGAAVITETCDKTKGQCVVASTQPCTGGQNCQGNACACSPNAGKPCNQSSCNPGVFDCAGKSCINTTAKDCPGDQVCMGAGQCGCPAGKVPGPNNTCCNAKVGKPCNENTCNPGVVACNGSCGDTMAKSCPAGQTCSGAGVCSCPSRTNQTANGCQPCGKSGLVCCDQGSTCDANLNCDGTCTPCGHDSQTCCLQGTDCVDSHNVCVDSGTGSGTCGACGDQDSPCCGAGRAQQVMTSTGAFDIRTQQRGKCPGNSSQCSDGCFGASMVCVNDDGAGFHCLFRP